MFGFHTYSFRSSSLFPSPKWQNNMLCLFVIFASLHGDVAHCPHCTSIVLCSILSKSVASSIRSIPCYSSCGFCHIFQITQCNVCMYVPLRLGPTFPCFSSKRLVSHRLCQFSRHETDEIHFISLKSSDNG